MMGIRSLSANAVTAVGAALFLLVLGGCSSSGDDPFSYVKVSGKVMYEDGSPIPAKNMMLTFLPESEAVGNRHPRPGWVIVDGKTGVFNCPTSHKAFDGLVRGKHKVLLTTDSGRAPLPANLVPGEYADPKKTPLEVDTEDLASFTLKVRKPAGGASTRSTPEPAIPRR